MTDSDFSSITPVENLHSVHSVAPAQQREEHKRRQKPPEQQQQQPPGNKPLNKTPEESTPSRKDDPHRIDYCA